MLVVHSQPAGANVTVDGVARGVTPLTVEGLASGDHEVVLQSATGTSRHTVKVLAGTTASLVAPATPAAPATDGPVSGWISVKAPFLIEIREDGNLIGTTETDRLMLASGRHVLEFVNQTVGYRQSRTVQVVPGKVAALTIELPQGTVNLNASPWAEVWLDGRRIGETPIGNLAVPIGPHEIVFRHPGVRREEARGLGDDRRAGAAQRFDEVRPADNSARTEASHEANRCCVVRAGDGDGPPGGRAVRRLHAAGTSECCQGPVCVGAIRRSAERAERPAHRRVGGSQVGRAVPVALPARARPGVGSRNGNRRRRHRRPDLSARRVGHRAARSRDVRRRAQAPAAGDRHRALSVGEGCLRSQGMGGCGTAVPHRARPHRRSGHGRQARRFARADRRLPRAQRARRGTASASGRAEADLTRTGHRAARGDGSFGGPLGAAGPIPGKIYTAEDDGSPSPGRRAAGHPERAAEP